MSAAPALGTAESRRFRRHAISVALDVIALRSGVPENLPGRCTDLSEGGVGGMVAGHLSPGQQVAIELRLPNVGVPLRARAAVRYQGRLHCGFEFLTLPAEQREMIRYWSFQRSSQAAPSTEKSEPQPARSHAVPAAPSTRRQIRVHARHFYFLLAAMLVLAGLAWWQWQRSWSELETGVQAGQATPLRVPPDTMEMRILAKTAPIYPEEARKAGIEGLAVLDAVITPEGSVDRLRPISGNTLLVRAAEGAVRLWKFEPYQSDGRPIQVETTITVDFRLN